LHDFTRLYTTLTHIWEEFYKTYFNLPRPIASKDTDGNDITKTFTGTDYADASFGLKIDVGPASVFSESLQVSILDKLHDSKELDKYAYVKYMPSNVVPSALKNDFEKEKKLMDEQAQMQTQAGSVIDKLTPEEQQVLQEDPTLLDQAMASVRGGM
jgi:hypothetical protein